MLAVFFFLLGNFGRAERRQRAVSIVTFILGLVGGEVRVLLANVTAELVPRLCRLGGHSMNFASVIIGNPKCDFFLVCRCCFHRRLVDRGDDGYGRRYRSLLGMCLFASGVKRVVLP